MYINTKKTYKTTITLHTHYRHSKYNIDYIYTQKYTQIIYTCNT